MNNNFLKNTLSNCLQATLLSIKREQGRISGKEKMKLLYHLAFCKPCRRFSQQSHAINRSGAVLTDKLFTNPPYHLSNEYKENIQKQLELEKH